MPVAPSPFILPKGVTGFGDRDWTPAPQGLLKELKALGHEIARGVHGRITAGAPGDLLGCNYHSLRLEGRGLSICLLLNAFHPLVGFAETDLEEPIFTEIPDSFLARGHGCFTFIGKAILASPPEDMSLRELVPAEIAQIEYWRPRRLGDIIFNRWD